MHTHTHKYKVMSLVFIHFIIPFFLLIPGEYLLFCKGADSSIFPRVVSGKVEQVKARVEQNAVVSVQLL